MRAIFNALTVMLALVAGCDIPSVATPATPTSAARPCDGAKVVDVSSAEQLTQALAAAAPGAVIRLAAGTYRGAFVAKASGTADAPITLCGPRTAVLDGGPISGGYTLHLDGAAHWQVSGFTVQNGQKGVMLDAAAGNLVEGLLVEGTGDEAVHLRKGSTDNIVRDNVIRDTGKRQGKFGEGIYVGTAESNWCEISACDPDRSDRNTIEDNAVSDTTAESVDIKEGTTGGVLRDNSFSGTGMTDATAWVNVKGNDWTIADNTGVDAPEDGFQVHQILDGWGLDNVFTGNVSTVNAGGYAVNITKNADRNRVSCTNTAKGAGKGLSSIECTR